MSCPDCGGIGFVYKRKDVEGRFTHNLYRNVTVVSRCPLYRRYWDELPGDPTEHEVNFHPLVCDAASQRHKEIREQGQKDGKGGKGRRI